VIKLVQRWQRDGTLAPEPSRGGRRARLAGHAERVHALRAATPDLTIAELKSSLAAEGIVVGPTPISRLALSDDIRLRLHSPHRRAAKYNQ
jgi:transposase